jgi:hypothetical protein
MRKTIPPPKTTMRHNATDPPQTQMMVSTDSMARSFTDKLMVTTHGT